VYWVYSGGGQSRTDCSISGSVSSYSTGTTRGTSFGGVTNTNSTWITNSYPNLGMHCRSYETQPVGWRHVLNTMLAVGSDGNAYVIACDAAFRWSKCRQLRTGDIFQAAWASKGLTIFATDPKGKAIEATYRVLSSRSLRAAEAQEPRPPTADQGVLHVDEGVTVKISCGQAVGDIYVDGKFVGSTPSTLKLSPGDHTISVQASGFKNWQRNITLSAGSDVTLNATLEKAQ
jgi:PEGA domain